jgi:hypothetical protein
VPLLLGGIGANLLTAWLGHHLLPPTTFSRLFIGLSVISAAFDLLPVQCGKIAFDGWHLVTLLNRGRGERWLALMRLDAEIAQGVPPECWPHAFIALAIKHKDQSPDTVRAHGLAHAAFDALGDREGAARALDVCLAHSSPIPALLKGDSDQ